MNIAQPFAALQVHAADLLGTYNMSAMGIWSVTFIGPTLDENDEPELTVWITIPEESSNPAVEYFRDKMMSNTLCDVTGFGELEVRSTIPTKYGKLNIKYSSFLSDDEKALLLALGKGHSTPTTSESFYC